MCKQEILDELGIKNGFAYGMHACGFVYDLMFTNSYEAFSEWYQRGVRIFEVDIDKTEDGGYVACHNFDRETFRKMEIDDIPDVCTEKWFAEQKLYHKSTPGITPVSLSRIFQIMMECPDVIFMIDPKQYSYHETCLMLAAIKTLLKKYNVAGRRIVFETYNLEMIRATRQFESMMYYQHCIDDEMQMGDSIKIREMDIERQIEILLNNDIHIISYPWKLAVERLEMLKRLKKEGFVIFSKTRNDIFSDLVTAAGVNVNIVDHLVDESQKEELEGYRTEYMRKYEKKIRECLGG